MWSLVTLCQVVMVAWLSPGDHRAAGDVHITNTGTLSTIVMRVTSLLTSHYMLEVEGSGQHYKLVKHSLTSLHDPSDRRQHGENYVLRKLILAAALLILGAGWPSIKTPSI